ncbi:nucleoside phosphorylase [Photobacterium sanguinicancri]|uniref:Uridine phosphorylase n=1 Tax=Photobacterium sanguinicancri TaxID=875932 RepID=A0AAW7Y9J7_9GAMM|nr:nucleoside phosphorylase [Photobacterium sanguinicancri]KXI22755.1 uridine phosphorylase [Photobacterium sanguinicancri]MDO6544655.1 nucleoside phosphorylase [Photobacterium sanguinicancri]
MSNDVKQPHIAVGFDDVSDKVIVCGEPDRVNRIATLLERSEQIAENREYRIISGYYQDHKITVCSTGIGSPSALIALEELTLCGAKYIVRVGSAGALQGNIGLGELIVAEGAVRDEGGSKAYVSSSYPAVASRPLTTEIERYLTEHAYPAHYGIVRSHDSFYTDEEDKICEHWSRKGVLGADMETSALFTVGKLRGIQVASILNNVVLYQQNVQEGVSEYANANDITVQGEMMAAKAALAALCRC